MKLHGITEQRDKFAFVGNFEGHVQYERRNAQVTVTFGTIGETIFYRGSIPFNNILER